MSVAKNFFDQFLITKSFGDTRSATGSKRISILAQLINASGEVLWSEGRQRHVIEGDAVKAATQIARHLLGAIQQRRKS